MHILFAFLLGVKICTWLSIDLTDIADVNYSRTVEHGAAVLSAYISAVECAAYRGDTDTIGVYYQSQFPQVIKLLHLRGTIFIAFYKRVKFIFDGLLC